MKRMFMSCLAILGLCLLLPIVAYADMGPKPSLKINAVNMPDSECYLDLLVDDTPNDARTYIEETVKYNQQLFSTLKEYNAEGYHAAMAAGSTLPLRGDIICNVKSGKCTINFKGYVPHKFKIIVVSADGSIKVSNVINRLAFNSIIKFNYSTGKASELPGILSFFLKFIVTCALTLIIEGLVLLCFKFSLKENWRAFVIINTSTQIFLTYTVYKYSSISASLAYMRFEFFIFIVEAYLFSIYLKGHSTARKVVFALTANAASFLIGLLIL